MRGGERTRGERATRLRIGRKAGRTDGFVWQVWNWQVWFGLVWFINSRNRVSELLLCVVVDVLRNSYFVICSS